MGEMRLRAQHSIPKLNTVVNKRTTTTFMKSVMLFFFLHILRWLSGKESACNAGDASLILGSGSSLKEEMAVYSSILAWEIPWTMVPSGLQSMGLQRDRPDLATKQQHMTNSTENENS